MAGELEKLLRNYIVGQIPLTTGVVASEETPLHDIIRSMHDQKSGCAVAKKGETITGIFTERDFLQKVLGEKVDWRAPFRQFTTPSPITMGEDELLRKALYVMRKKGIRHIPILGKDNTLKGVLSVRNIVKLLAEHFPTQVMNLPPRVKQVAETAEGG